MNSFFLICAWVILQKSFSLIKHSLIFKNMTPFHFAFNHTYNARDYIATTGSIIYSTTLNPVGLLSSNNKIIYDLKSSKQVYPDGKATYYVFCNSTPVAYTNINFFLFDNASNYKISYVNSSNSISNVDYQAFYLTGFDLDYNNSGKWIKVNFSMENNNLILNQSGVVKLNSYQGYLFSAVGAGFSSQFLNFQYNGRNYQLGFVFYDKINDPSQGLFGTCSYDSQEYQGGTLQNFIMMLNNAKKNTNIIISTMDFKTPGVSNQSFPFIDHEGNYKEKNPIQVEKKAVPNDTNQSNESTPIIPQNLSKSNQTIEPNNQIENSLLANESSSPNLSASPIQISVQTNDNNLTNSTEEKPNLSQPQTSEKNETEVPSIITQPVPVANSKQIKPPQNTSQSIQINPQEQIVSTVQSLEDKIQLNITLPINQSMSRDQIQNMYQQELRIHLSNQQKYQYQLKILLNPKRVLVILSFTGGVLYQNVSLKLGGKTIFSKELYMLKPLNQKSSALKSISSISENMLTNKTFSSRGMNAIRQTGVLTAISNFPQLISLHVIPSAEITENLWENQRLISLTNWKIIPNYEYRFCSMLSGRQYDIFGNDVTEEVEKNNPDPHSSFNQLMISNYFLVDYRSQLIVITIVILIQLNLNQKTEINILKGKIKDQIKIKLSQLLNLQLLCRIFESYMLLTFVTFFYSLCSPPFSNGFTLLNVSSFLIGLLIVLINLFSYGHQFKQAQSYRQYLLERQKLRQTNQDVDYFMRDTQSFGQPDVKLYGNWFQYNYHYVMVLKKILLIFFMVVAHDSANICLIGFILIQSISLIFTTIVRPYEWIILFFARTIANTLMIVGLVYRFMINREIQTFKQDPQNNTLDTDRMDQYGMIVIYLEWGAIMLDALLQIGLIAYNSYKSKQSKQNDEQNQNHDQIQKSETSLVEATPLIQQFGIEDGIMTVDYNTLQQSDSIGSIFAFTKQIKIKVLVDQFNLVVNLENKTLDSRQQLFTCRILNQNETDAQLQLKFYVNDFEIQSYEMLSIAPYYQQEDELLIDSEVYPSELLIQMILNFTPINFKLIINSTQFFQNSPINFERYRKQYVKNDLVLHETQSVKYSPECLNMLKVIFKIEGEGLDCLLFNSSTHNLQVLVHIVRQLSQAHFYYKQKYDSLQYVDLIKQLQQDFMSLFRDLQ